MKKRYSTLLVVMGIVAVLLLVGYPLFTQRAILQNYTGEEFLMDTFVSISTYGTDTALLREATRQAFQEMRRIAELTDRFATVAPERATGEPHNPDKANASNKEQAPGSEGRDRHNADLDTVPTGESAVARINAMAGIKPVRVDKDVFTMLQMAQEYHQLTQGAFDVTIGPVMDLWGFGLERKQVPAPEELQAALSLVDSKDMTLDEESQSVFLKKKGMSLDLGAVAKGYAVEKAAQILEKAGVKQAIINAGGNIRVLGKKEEQPWKVGIQDPRNPEALIGILSLTDESAVTSGDYQRVKEIDGKSYHHIISPLTGYPAEENISVTVVTPDSGRADLLSTALFLMEPQQALALVEQIPDTEMFLVTDDKKIFYTSGLEGKIELTPGEEYAYAKKMAD